MLPRSLSEVVAQDVPKVLLLSLVTTNNVPKTLLFSGPSGTGKTTMARIFAATLNCLDRTEEGACGVCSSCLEITQTQSSPNVIEVDAATSGSAEEVRKLMSLSQMMAAPNTRRCIILDEAQAMSKQAFQSLLKTMETSLTTVFILVTTEPAKILDTVRSRSVEIPFSDIPDFAILSHLISIGTPQSQAAQIVAYSHGSLRVALNLHLLSSISSVSLSDLMGDRIEFQNLGEAICAGNLKASLSILETCLLDGMNQDLFITRLIDYFLSHAPAQEVFQLTKILWELRSTTWIKRNDLLRLAVTQMVAVFPATGHMSILNGEMTPEKVLSALTGDSS